MELNFRPTLTRGAHLNTSDETGAFCLVEAVGFNADRTVHDHHSSVDTVLAAMARGLNDRMCGHDGLTRGHAGYPGDKANICQDCQARLWAVGERIAGTGTLELDAQDRAHMHLHLAIVAAEAALRKVDKASGLHTLAEAAVEAAKVCVSEPGAATRVAARAAADDVDAFPFTGQAECWAGDAAAQAARSAALYTSAVDAEDQVMALEPVTRRATYVVSYAVFAAAGDVQASMRLARKVLNAFGKATSQKATPGVSESGACPGCGSSQPNWLLCPTCEAEHHGCNECAAAAAAMAADLPAGAVVAYGCEERTTVAGIGYPCVKLGDHVEHETALGAVWWTPVDPDDAGAAAADAAEPQFAEAAYREAYAEAFDRNVAYAEANAGEIDAADRDERLQRAIAAAPSWAQCEAAFDASLSEAVASGEPVVVAAVAAEAVTENEDMNDFDESELADVADEAIGDAAALDDNLQRAEAILNAIAAEHRAVETLVRTARENGTDAGEVTEYYQDCCVVCRDAKGRPVPAPCRTMTIVSGFGEL